MPKLTAVGVAKLRAQGKRREIPDTQAPGLRLIIQPSGTKSWALRFRRPGGRTAKLTLGRVDLSEAEARDEPVIGAALSLRMARQLANKIDRERARGIDVVEESKAEKLRRRAAAIESTENSFGAAAQEFFRDYKTKWGNRPRRWRGEAAILGLRWPIDGDPATAEPQVIKGGLADRWRSKPLASVDNHDVHAVVDEARKLGIPGLARKNDGISDARGRKIHAALSVLFRWAVRQRRVAVNPCAGEWRPGAPPSRERVLTNVELRWFWQATEHVGAPFNAVRRLLMLSGCKLNEIAGLRWEELSEDGTALHLSGTRAKNHRPFTLPLSSAARDIIAGIKRVEGCPFAFSTTGKTPVSGWSKIKQRLDDAMLAAARKERGKGAMIAAFRVHDMRRSVVSGMAELGIRPDVIELCVNHVSGHRGGVAGIYNKSELLAERRAALERWAAHIAGIVSDKPGSVVSLRTRR